MRHVTVKDPLPGLSRRPDHVPPLSRSDIDDVGLKPRRGIEWNSIPGYDGEWSAVHVHWVDEVVIGADDSKLDSLANFHVQRVGGGPGFAIYGEEVRKAAFHQHRRIGLAVAIQPFLKLHHVFVVCLWLGG